MTGAVAPLNVNVDEAFENVMSPLMLVPNAGHALVDTLINNWPTACEPSSLLNAVELEAHSKSPVACDVTANPPPRKTERLSRKCVFNCEAVTTSPVTQVRGVVQL
jgi:hypothetical protein